MARPPDGARPATRTRGRAPLGGGGQRARWRPSCPSGGRRRARGAGGDLPRPILCGRQLPPRSRAQRHSRVRAYAPRALPRSRLLRGAAALAGWRARAHGGARPRLLRGALASALGLQGALLPVCALPIRGRRARAARLARLPSRLRRGARARPSQGVAAAARPGDPAGAQDLRSASPAEAAPRRQLHATRAGASTIDMRGTSRGRASVCSRSSTRDASAPSRACCQIDCASCRGGPATSRAWASPRTGCPTSRRSAGRSFSGAPSPSASTSARSRSGRRRTRTSITRRGSRGSSRRSPSGAGCSADRLDVDGEGLDVGSRSWPRIGGRGVPGVEGLHEQDKLVQPGSCRRSRPPPCPRTPRARSSS